MEVVRDKKDNCIIVCSIENIDPMGIHTGDSVTVAPALTLTDKEYQVMRNASIACLRKIGVETGGSNVQFAINPKNAIAKIFFIGLLIKFVTKLMRFFTINKIFNAFFNFENLINVLRINTRNIFVH